MTIEQQRYEELYNAFYPILGELIKYQVLELAAMQEIDVKLGESKVKLEVIDTSLQGIGIINTRLEGIEKNLEDTKTLEDKIAVLEAKTLLLEAKLEEVKVAVQKAYSSKLKTELKIILGI